MTETNGSMDYSIGPGGDTLGPISFSDITKLDTPLKKLIGLEETLKPQGPTESTLIKRNPEDLAKKLQLSQSQPLLSSHEQIRKKDQEILQLKLEIHNLKSEVTKLRQQTSGPSDNDEFDQDNILELLDENERLKRELEERDEQEKQQALTKSQLRDASCQTHLDRLNIEQFILDSIALKKARLEPPPNMTPDEKKLQEKLAQTERLISGILEKLSANRYIYSKLVNR